MKTIKKYLFILVTLLATNQLTFAQQSLTWQASNEIVSFKDLSKGSFIFLNEEYLNKGKTWNKSLTDSDLNNKITVNNSGEEIKFTSLLAAENPMNWELRIIDDKNAEWFNLSCDCNIGLESALLVNNTNPYNKPMATLHLNDDATITVTYHENFIKDVLKKSSFSNNFFKKKFTIYQQKQ